MTDWTSSETGRVTPFGLPLIARHVAHRTASLWRPLRFPWATDPLTRGTISRLLVSASWVAKCNV